MPDDLKFTLKSPDYAVSECGMYECSITRKGGKQRILVFAHTGEKNNPVMCIGHSDTPAGAKRLAESWRVRNGAARV